MKRIGFATGYSPEIGVKEMAGWMREADERKYDIAFFSETIELMRDSVSTIAGYAFSTRNITLGSTQVVRLRSPVVMALTLGTLDELSNGRMILALGACTASHALRHALEPVDPALSLREYVEVIRELLTGGEVTYHGKTIAIENVRLSWKPIRSKVPLWIAATSRTGLRIAGEIGDGVLLNANASADYSRNAIGIIREAAEKAGRDFSQFEIAQVIVTSVSDNHDEAVNAVRWEVATKFDPVQLPFNARPRMRVGEPYIKEEDLPKFEEAYKKGGKEGLMRAVPKSYLEGLTASGTPDEVKNRIEEYRKAGVKLPMIRPATSKQAKRLLELFSPT